MNVVVLSALLISTTIALKTANGSFLMNDTVLKSQVFILHKIFLFVDFLLENILLKELYVEPRNRHEAETNRSIGFDNKYLGLIAPCKVNTSIDR